MRLVGHGLGDAAQAAIAAALDQQAMEELVGLGLAGQIIASERLVHRRGRSLQLVGSGHT